MIWLEVVAAFAAGVGLGFWLRLRWPVRQTLDALKGSRYRIRRSDGKMMYVGDNSNTARETYNTMPLPRGMFLEFFEGEKWRGRRDA